MRISERLVAFAGLTIALAACGSAPEPPRERIACALDGAKDFAEVCLLERDGPRFSIHRPDGGFRRFEPVEGQGIRSIDGAYAAIVVPRANGFSELAIEGDRYLVQVARPRDSSDQVGGE
ncbi:MAG: hypothetical protein Q8R44_14100 [Novosphingobium sp.]|nr:hypothetical protein [Novosphingobium sp.]